MNPSTTLQSLTNPSPAAGHRGKIVRPWHRALGLFSTLFLFLGSSAFAASFTAGNLAIVQADASANNTTASVIELVPNAANPAPSNIIAIDGATLPNALRFSGSAASTLYLANSADGSLLVFTGHNSTSTSVNANTLLPRGVATFNAAGTFALATTYTGANGNQTRSATSLDNTHWFIGDQGGLYTNGGTTASAAANLRGVKACGSTVYGLQASSTPTVIVVSTIVSPTATSVAGLPGLTNNAAAQDFYLISSANNGVFDVLYVLSATTNTAGTINKYSLVSGTWTANGSFTTTFGGFGLAAAGNGLGGAYLYVSTGLGAATANNVLRLTDTAGFNTTLAINTGDNLTLYTAPAGKIVKGVAFAPVAAVVTQPDLAVNVTVPATAMANAHFDFTISASNLGAANATGVAVDFTLPAGLTFVTAAGDSGFTGSFGAGVVHFTSGSINAAGSATLTVTASGAAAGMYTAPAGAAVIDPGNTVAESNEGNNASPAAATIQVLAASNNANLSNLVLSTGAASPAFAAAKLTYAQVLPNTTASLTITPTVADATATVTVNGTPVVSGNASDLINLNEGINTILTVVTAQDGTTQKTYTAKVVRQSNAVFGPGAIAFTGFNADGEDDLAFAALTDIPANTVIFFTDDEWNGTDWADSAESQWAWVATADIAGGSVVTMSNISSLYAGGTVTNLGTIVPISDATDNAGLSNGADAVFAFQGAGVLNANGSEEPTAFLAVISNDDPVAAGFSLTGTGLSEAAGTAIIFTESDDGVRYKGARNGLLNFADYLPLLADRAANWDTVGGLDGTIYVPFSTAPFTAGPTVIVTIDDVAVNEGNAGTTALTFTVTRGNNTGAFTVQYATADGIGPAAATVADNDYQAATGTVTFTEDGELTQPVTVLINGDIIPEHNETFFVNLSNIVSTAGNAVISDGQGIGTILTDDPAAPTITTQPASLAIAIGGQAVLKVAVEGFPVPTFQWYEGSSGDTSAPIASATSATFTTPVLLADANYWVRVTNSQGSVDSDTAAITVSYAAPISSSGGGVVLNPNQASWNPAGVNVGGTQFVNLGLQGVGRFPASAIDPATGETLGSISDMQITGWHKNGDGSYGGTLNTLPDRGYNAGAIFSNYAARINQFDFTFTPYTDPAPTAAQNQVAMTFAGSTRFTYDHDANPATPPVFTTGLVANAGVPLFGTTVPVVSGDSTQSDGTVTNRLTLDSEGLILDSRLGRSGTGWVGDEYGPYIYHFNSAKELDGTVTLPAALIPHAVAGGDISFSDGNVDGRRVNQGMEGIAQSPDGTRLFGLMQSATIQDSGPGSADRFNTRLVVYDISGSDTPATPVAQYVIQLPRIDDTGSTTNGQSVNKTAAQSCIVALNDHQLLILSRDGNGRGVDNSPSPVFKSILLADLSAATNINGLYDDAGQSVSPGAVLAPAITPLNWVEALNMIGRLGSTLSEVEKFGLNLHGGNGDINTICEKWESLGLVPAKDPANPNDYFLFIGNDNDFLTGSGKYLDAAGAIQSYDAGLENDTLVLVFRVRFTAPELLVQQPAGSDLESGGSSPFGPVNLGQNATQVFTVKNAGTSVLTINSIGVTGGEAAEFAVDLTGTSLSLAPGAATTFGVTFAPSATGVRATTLQIVNNDFSAGSFAIALTGNGNSAPTVAADHASVVGNTGSPIGNTGTYGDPDGDSVTLSASVGTIVPHAGGTWSWSITPAADVVDQLVTITADDGTATATTTFTYTSHTSGLAGNYVVLLTGANGAASLQIKITAGHRISGYVRLPNGQRVRLPGAIVPASNSVTLTLSDGSSLTLSFDSFGHLVASLSGPAGSFSGAGDLDVSSSAPLAGNYTAILEADDGAIGWLQMIVSSQGAVRLAGKLPDGTAVLSGQGTNVERDGQVAIMILSSAPGHPQVFGEATFADLATSDISAALTWTDATHVSQGLALSGARVGSGPGASLPLTIDGTGLNISSSVTLGTSSVFSPPVTGLSYSATTGIFRIDFRRSLPKGQIMHGSGVYQQKLGVGAGNFPFGAAAGRIVIGTLP